MKKILFGCIAIVIMICLYKKEDFVIIPNESIRIRVISSSNSLEDLYQKKIVKNDLEDYLYKLLSDVSNIDDARNIIQDNMDNIDNLIKGENIGNYTINFGSNYFPKKVYKGVMYPSGEYESLEVKLGSGIGDNYWCVLFPPLCMINENEITGDVEYKLYVRELLKN